jgi:hypothetical protein
MDALIGKNVAKDTEHRIGQNSAAEFGRGINQVTRSIEAKTIHFLRNLPFTGHFSQGEGLGTSPQERAKVHKLKRPQSTRLRALEQPSPRTAHVAKIGLRRREVNKT